MMKSASKKKLKFFCSNISNSINTNKNASMDYATAQKILAERNGFRQSLKRDISHATEMIKINRELVDKDEAELNILMKKSNKKKSNKKSQDKIRAVLASLHVHKWQVKFHKQEIMYTTLTLEIVRVVYTK